MIRAVALACALALGVTAPIAAQGVGSVGGVDAGSAAGARATEVAGAAAAQDTMARGNGAVVRDTTAQSDGSAAADTTTPPLREQVLRKLRALEAASRLAPAKADSGKASSTPGDSAQAAGDSASVDSTRAAQRAGKSAPVDSAETAHRARGAQDAGQTGDQVAGAAGDSARAAAPLADTAAGHAAGGAPIRFGAAPVAGVIPASDSVVARLLALEGYVVTEYQAANARFDGESGQLDLVGEPRLARGQESMEADSLLRYDQRTSIVCGYGKPVLTGTGSDPVSSDQVCYDVNRQVGVAMGARTTFTQQGTWFVHGTELYTSGTNRLYCSATSFTSCDLDEPHYHFSASELKVVHESVMVARNVTIKFGDVPVLWLPFMIQSLKPDRRSGLLTPTLGLQHVVRTSKGYRREIRDIGFYWALNDHLGLTTALDWQSGGYMALNGRLQYRWLRQFLNGDISFRRYWMAEGNTNFALSGNTNWQPGERTTLRASMNYSSSNDLVRRYSADPEELNRSIASKVGLSHRFGWGNFSLNGNRQQHLSNDHVDLTFPSVSLSLNPVTLFPATGDARWYNNATWRSSANFTARSRTVNLLLPSEHGQNTSSLQGGVNSQFTMGKLSWSSDFNFNEDVRQDRPTWYDPMPRDTANVDSLAYRREVSQTMTWSTGLSYTQRLIENTHLSPSISLRGGLRMPRPDSAGVTYGRVEEPTRLTMGASLRTNLFGFWPGVGPYSRIRHRIEPSLRYSYSPVPTVTEQQRRAFGTAYDLLKETNELSLTVSQTFEAKPKASAEATGTAAEETEVGAFGDTPPRRTTQIQPITLLSVSSSALLYNFARAREGEYGLTTTQMNHTIRSDLLRELSLSVGHDLFREEPGAEGMRAQRSFSPHLRSVTAQFSLSSESWPFRLFRSGGAGDGEEKGNSAPADSLAGDEQNDFTRSVIPGRSGRSNLFAAGGQGVGSWRGGFSYSLTRPGAGMAGEENQMITADITFQPTENWNVSWRTGYSFTLNEFSNHTLTLSRDLHRWRAGFNFVRTQYGSFAFHFNVQLLDNPDIKVDYDQRSLPPPTQFR
jgi:hypothetical protein